ncbi:hypothetical protein [Simiduia aestuariiviva]|uniref:Uncharacterized protein n=1 Tax=Simiduia aestuariiviva TaxID=1510459 RepID=A0A839US70_9GAMM|nr:hypothetical protein [Simiduia aestuariiviva]MBB3169541.1 hypothetical protein [Simiduia aestuariiviva]
MNGIANLGFQTHQPNQQKTQRFIPFSANTTGKCGRPVFIDAKLLPDFLINIDLKTYRGLQIVRGIEMLRSVGGGINAYQSKLKAAKHMSVIGELEIYYYIAQQNPSGNEVSGVYITELSNAAKNTAPAGNYIVKSGKANPNNLTQFSGDQACIGGAANLELAISDAREHIETDGWGRSPDYGLYFIPDSLQNIQGTWLTPEQKTVKISEHASELATILTTTQKNRLHTKSPIRIRVFNGGCKVLCVALKSIQGHLDKLGFELIDPDVSANSTLKEILAHDARLSPDAIQFTKKSTEITLSSVRNSLAKTLSALGNKKSAENILNKTSKQANALSVGNNLITNNNYFLDAARQASILGQWSKQ